MPPAAIPSSSTRFTVDALHRARSFYRPNKENARPRLRPCCARRTNKRDNALATDGGDSSEVVQVEQHRKQLSWAPQSGGADDEVLGSTRSGRRTKKLVKSGQLGEPNEPSETEADPTSSLPVVESEHQPVPPGYKEIDGSMVKDSGWLGAGMRWYLILTRYRKERRATEYLTEEIPKLPPLVDANGVASERKFSVWFPQKTTKAWNTSTKKMSKKTLNYGNGESIFLECIMDNEIFNLVNASVDIQFFRQKHALMDWVPMPCTDALMHSAYDWIWEDHEVDEQEANRRLEGSEFEAAKDYLFIPDVDVNPQSTDDAVEFIDLVTAGLNVEENAEAARKERQREEDDEWKRKLRKRRGKKFQRKRRDRSRSPARDDDARSMPRSDRSGKDYFEASAAPPSSSSGASDWDSWEQPSNEQSWSNASDQDLASWDAEWGSKAVEEPVDDDDALSESGSKPEAKVDSPVDDGFDDLISNFSSRWGDSAPVEEAKQAMGEEQLEADIASLFVDKLDDPDLDTDDAAEFSNDFDGGGEAWDLGSSLMDSLPGDDPLDNADALLSAPQSKKDEENSSDGAPPPPQMSAPPQVPKKKPTSRKRKSKKVDPFVDLDSASSEPASASGFSGGDEIVVVSGPFQEFGGKVVSEVSDSRIKVELDVFGRATTVEVDVDSLERSEG